MCAVRGVRRAEANTDEVVRVQEKTETKKAPPSPAGGSRLGNQSQRCINLRASASIASRKLLLPGTSQQFIDDLLQRRRINVTPEGLRNFPDRVVGRRHSLRSSRAAPPRFNAARGSGARGKG